MRPCRSRGRPAACWTFNASTLPSRRYAPPASDMECPCGLKLSRRMPCLNKLRQFKHMQCTPTVCDHMQCHPYALYVAVQATCFLASGSTDYTCTHMRSVALPPHLQNSALEVLWLDLHLNTYTFGLEGWCGC